ncbi:MAG: ABC transporter substrate-binding protein [Burkholderiaceae bacterium]|nr:MAG: ABC transporter substrate-binding protein [Burkholderiaceae bacterium]TAM07658.1 MAG: ABC transporter substrate-binding protein [Pusillimonas sp.]
MKIAIPDLISNSYFPAIAAVELGIFKQEGIDVELELISPVDHTLEVLRDGKIDFAGGAAHSVPFAFPEWKGAKLLGALAQNMYWFLVLRKDLGARKGDINAIKGLHIGAAPLVDLGLKRLLVESGIDIERDNVQIGPVPGAFLGENKNFGVAAAKALGAGLIDGFWANGMGAEVAVRSGAGDIIIDARRGDGPPKAIHYTLPALITSEALIQRNPEAVVAAVRALVKTQQLLKADVSLATKIGHSLFPEAEAKLIAGVVERDLPFYGANLSHEFIAGMTEFQLNMGMIRAPVPYENIVATQFSHLWNNQE